MLRTQFLQEIATTFAILAFSFKLPQAPTSNTALSAGSVHDTVCMRLFAAGLLATGLKDEAAGIYYSLLQEGSDRAQQVARFDCSSLHVCM